MQIKINREIQDYKESMFMGLSLRQCVYSVLAMLAAVAIYFLLKPVAGVETLSWACIVGAFPFVMLGFVNYNKMPAEKLLKVWIRSNLLTPRQLKYIPNNFYYAALRDSIEQQRKEGRKRHGKKAAET